LYIYFLPTHIFLYLLYFSLHLRILLVCLFAYSHFLHLLLLLYSSSDICWQCLLHFTTAHYDLQLWKNISTTVRMYAMHTYRRRRG